MRPLLIVESEAKARTLCVNAESDMDSVIVQTPPMTVSHDPGAKDIQTGESGFRFTPSPSGKEILEALERGDDRNIIVAFDSDQRGEYWSWLLNGYLNSLPRQKPCRRITAWGFTPEGVKEALENLAEISGPAGAAVYIRSLFNVFLGLHLKRLLGTSSGPEDLPLDYTTLTVLFLLAERQSLLSPDLAEITWKLRVTLSADGEELVVVLRDGDGMSKDTLISDPEQVKRMLAELPAESFVVENVRRRPWQGGHPAPLELSGIYHDGFCILGMAPREIWLTLLKLYYGVETGKGPIGLISDPYSGVSENKSVMDGIRGYLARMHGRQEVAARDYSPKAILPLQPHLSGEELSAALTANEIGLYNLIRSRALMSQMVSAEGEEVEVTVHAGGYVLRGLGIDFKEQGFFKEDRQDFRCLAQPLCSQLHSGDQLKPVEVSPQQTVHPAAELYTLSTLVDDLTEFSIPPSSRLPSVLQSMLEKKYIRMLPDGSIWALENTRKVVDAVNRAFPKMQGINLSAYYEQTVTEVISGRKDVNFALKQFDQNFHIQGVPLVKKSVAAPAISPVRRSKNVIKGSEDGQSGGGPALPPSQPENQDAGPVRERACISAVARDDHDCSETEGMLEVRQDIDEQAQRQKQEELEHAAGEAGETADLQAEGHESQNTLMPGECDQDSSGQKDSLAAAGADEEDDAQSSRTVRAFPENQRPDAEEELLEEEEAGIASHCTSDGQAVMSQEDRVDISCPFCSNTYLALLSTPAGKAYYECPVSNCEFIAWARPHGISCPNCKSPYLVEKARGGATHLQCPKAGCGYEQPFGGEEERKGAASQEGEGKKKKLLVRRKKTGAAPGGSTRKVVVRRKRA